MMMTTTTLLTDVSLPLQKNTTKELPDGDDAAAALRLPPSPRNGKRQRRCCCHSYDDGFGVVAEGIATTTTIYTTRSNDWYDDICYNHNNNDDENDVMDDDADADAAEEEEEYFDYSTNVDPRMSSADRDMHTVRSSWLKEIKWISSSSGTSNCIKNLNNITTTTTATTTTRKAQSSQLQQLQQNDPHHHHPLYETSYDQMIDDDQGDDYNNNNHTMDELDSYTQFVRPQQLLPVQYEIQHIRQQLLQVKRRLQPAIERYNNIDSLTTTGTTIKNIFQEARRICNPYEVLGKRYCATTTSSRKSRYNCNENGLNDTFINRSAIKLANIDAILDFCLTTTTTTSTPHAHNCSRENSNENDSRTTTSPVQQQKHAGTTWKFVDLCGAPGGFSEYILWRRIQLQLQHDQDKNTWNPTAITNGTDSNKNNDNDNTNSNNRKFYTRGYGMSLVGSNEHGNGIPWTLHDTTIPPANEMNSPFSTSRQRKQQQQRHYQYRICNGVDGTGDIYNWDNVIALQEAIYNDDDDELVRTSEETHEYSNSIMNTYDEHDNKGDRGKVHLVVVDGGFDAQRDSEYQEEISIKLVVCEAAAALSLLRTGGVLIMKLFGFQTPIIRNMMVHLFMMFDCMIAIKPISSRPASAERYVVCYGFHNHSSTTNWSGQRWCNDLYLGRPYTIPTPTNAGQCHVEDTESYFQKETRLLQYIDEFDRDICTLNLKASFAMLSYIERKCLYHSQQQRSSSNGEHGSSDDQEWEDDVYYDEMPPKINIPMYRIAWRLDG